MKKSFLRDKAAPIISGIVFTGIILFASSTTFPPIKAFVDRMENLAYDFRLRHTLDWREKLPSPVVIVDIDERSLQEEGRWPWDRSKVADMVTKLYQHGAIVVGFDVIFSEPQANEAEKVLDHAAAVSNLEITDPKLKQQLIAKFDHDKTLARSLEMGDSVLGLLLHSEGSDPKGELPAPLFTVEGRTISIPSLSSYTANVPVLQNAATAGGFVTTIRDNDGVVRRTPMILRVDDRIYGSLSLLAAKAYLLADQVTVDTEVIGGIERVLAVKIDNLTIDTDERGQVMVPFQGKRNYFPYIPATDVLHDKVDPGLLDGSIVLVGTSALGLADLPSTAVEGVYPGVEVHANNIAGILNQKFPSTPVWIEGANFVLLGLTGLIMAIVFPMLGPVHVTWLSLAFMTGMVGTNIWMWVDQNIVMDIVLPVTLVIGLVLITMTYGFVFEARRKRQITEMFGQYVSSDLVEEMSDDPEHYSFEGKSLEMTVLFADIRSFTTLSESLSAAQLKDLLNRYFEPMTKIIFDSQGTIDKYVGDMIMAFWGAPKSDPEQAANAVAAALEMQKQSAVLSEEFEKDGLPQVSIGIGINTGIMNVGDMGSIYRRAYTVLGDNVNLGSRFEASTRFYGSDILVGEDTKSQAENYVYQMIDFVKVKGKKKPVAVYEPLCDKSELTPELEAELEKYHAAFELYQQQQWEQAIAEFAALEQQNQARHLYALYHQRCLAFRDEPPGDDWDGSFTRTEK